MLPLAVVAVVGGPEFIDWTKASDDVRFALLQPVMTEREVMRLFAGKEGLRQACGMATDAERELVNYYGVGYSYQLTARDRPTGISTDLHQKAVPPPPRPRSEAARWVAVGELAAATDGAAETALDIAGVPNRQRADVQAEQVRVVRCATEEVVGETGAARRPTPQNTRPRGQPR